MTKYNEGLTNEMTLLYAKVWQYLRHGDDVNMNMETALTKAKDAFRGFMDVDHVAKELDKWTLRKL